jgi:hypothetical protein
MTLTFTSEKFQNYLARATREYVTALMLSAQVENFNSFWIKIIEIVDEKTQRKLLLQENLDGWTAFHLQTALGVEDVQETILKKNRNGESLIHFVVKSKRILKKQISFL